MTNDEKVLAVTSKLTGEFYVGQRVCINNPMSAFHDNCAGTVTEILPNIITVLWDGEGKIPYHYVPAVLRAIEQPL